MTDEPTLRRIILHLYYNETSDLGMCDHYRGIGTCSFGCSDEPECQTCHPREGWLTEQFPELAEILEFP